MTTPTTEEREQALIAMRAELAATVAALEAATADLEPVERSLAGAQAVYDEAGAERGRAIRAMGPADPYATSMPKTGADLERESANLRSAEAAFEQADRELGRRLVARTSAHVRRSDLLMAKLRLEGRIEQAAAELERARQQPPEQDLLQRIRQRIRGQAG